MIVGVVLCSFWPVPIAEAHKVSSASVLVEVDTKKHSYQVGAALDVAPSQSQALNEQISPEDAARTFAKDYLTVLFDKTEQKPELSIHTETASDKETSPDLQRKQVIVNLRGKIPRNAKDFLLYVDLRCPMAVVMVFIKDQQPARRMQVVLPGEYSRPFNVEPVLEGNPFEESGASTSAKQVESPAATGASQLPAANVCSFGLRLFSGETYLIPALLAAVLLWALELRTALLLIALLVVGQGAALSLFAFGLGGIRPGWFQSVTAVGLIAIAASSIFRKKQGPLWMWAVLIVVIGFFGGMFLSGATSFRELRSTGGMVHPDRLALFLLGFGIFQFLVGTIMAFFLRYFSVQKWYRNSFGLPAASVLVGYGIFILVERWM